MVNKPDSSTYSLQYLLQTLTEDKVIELSTCILLFKDYIIPIWSGPGAEIMHTVLVTCQTPEWRGFPSVQSTDPGCSQAAEHQREAEKCQDVSWPPAVWVSRSLAAEHQLDSDFDEWTFASSVKTNNHWSQSSFITWGLITKTSYDHLRLWQWFMCIVRQTYDKVKISHDHFL